MPTVSEVPLKEGLKIMFANIAIAHNMAAPTLSQSDWLAHEDELVDKFIQGLRINGYEIVPIASATA